MLNNYWIDIVHPRGKSHVGEFDYEITHVGNRSFNAVGDRSFGAVGRHDYDIQTSYKVGDRKFAAVGKKYRLAAEVETVGGHHHHHSRSQRYWGQPLFFVPEYGDVAVNSTATDPDQIPDAVQGFSGKNVLKPNQGLKPGQSISSPNGLAKLFFQKDGNLVLYASNNVVLWTTGTGPGRGANYVLNQGDGNFVVYAGYPRSNQALWASDTNVGHPLDLVVQNDGNLVLYESDGRPRWATNTQGFRPYKHHSLGGDLVHAVNTVTAIAGAPINAVTSVLEKIPIVGPILHEGLALDPVKAVGGLTARVLQGERIDKAFLDTGKEQLQHVRALAPYVSTVMSFVPGVGTGVAAAIAAGTALAEGRSISDAVLEGVKGAVPGGQLGKTVLSAALAITHGESVSKATLDAVKSQLPASLRTAVDTAVAAAGGKNVRVAVLQAMGNQLPAEAKKALQVGVALGAARNIQAAAVKAAVQPANQAKLAAKALPSVFQAALPKNAEEAKGYRTAMGLLQHKGVPAHALLAVHEHASPAAKKGVEHAIKTYKNHFTQNTYTSLVRGGLVTRGPWRQVPATTKGAIPGRLVTGKAVMTGHFVRV